MPASSDIPPLEIYWQLKASDLAHLTQLVALARIADSETITGLILPDHRRGPDGSLAAAQIFAVTNRLRLALPVRPGLLSPVLAARQVAALSNFSAGRIDVQLLNDGSSADNKPDGLHLSAREREHVFSEFALILKDLLIGDTVDFLSEHFHLEGAALDTPVPRRRVTRLFARWPKSGLSREKAASIDHWLIEPEDRSVADRNLSASALVAPLDFDPLDPNQALRDIQTWRQSGVNRFCVTAPFEADHLTLFARRLRELVPDEARETGLRSRAAGTRARATDLTTKSLRLFHGGKS